MANDYKKKAIEQAKHLSDTLGVVVDHNVLVCAVTPLDDDNTKIVKFMDTYGNAAPLYVPATNWKDLFMSLRAIDEAVTFILTAPEQD